MESKLRNPGIQDCRGFPYTGRYTKNFKHYERKTKYGSKPQLYK